VEGRLRLDGRDYLVERDGRLWRVSVPCFCGAGALSPRDWHWHEVAQSDDPRALVVLVSTYHRTNPTPDVEGAA
jgi:hypothetical protein